MNIHEFISSLDESCFENLSKHSIYRRDKLFTIWKDSCKKTKNERKIPLAYISKMKKVKIVYFDKYTLEMIECPNS